MIKLILIGVWVCAVTLASSYAAVIVQTGSAPQPENEKLDGGLEYVKPKTVNVPVIADGAVQGYVVAQLVFTVEAKLMKRFSVKPEPLFLDAAFKEIYAGEMIDFRRFRKQDLPALGKRILENVNKRLGSQLVQDVLIQDLNYVAKEGARGRVLQ